MKILTLCVYKLHSVVEQLKYIKTIFHGRDK